MNERAGTPARFLTVFTCLGLIQAAHGAEPPNADQLLKIAATRIESIRQAPLQIEVVDAKGNPVRGAAVRVEQRRHSFLFGCNVFSLYTHTNEQHQLYASRFSELFNYATLPFYWGRYEPTPGDTRAAHDLNKRLAQWCKAYHIETKGHPLIWHEVYPKWGPMDPDPARDAMRARIAAIVPEFKSDVHRWDVVNEATVARNFTNGIAAWIVRDTPAKMVTTALQWAHEADPDAELVYNDWYLEPEHVQLIEQLIKNNAPFHVIGLQSHMHQKEWPLEKVWDKCETYSKFGKPLHFTEVTVLSGTNGWQLPRPWPTTPEGERRQADYVEKLYTLLFSHPAVQAITWWDLQDGGWQGAPAGLIRADLTPKPAYERLLKLIRQTWWTRQSLTSNEKGQCAFTGFLGDYEVTVQSGNRSAVVQKELEKDTTRWTIKIE
jgi:endo-1,4-beta-xylanase